MKLFKTNSRKSWRSWLKNNYIKEKEIWFVFPNIQANEKSISYNDAVEEALCFGWIDGQAKKLDSMHQLRRFTPRKANSNFSRINIERLIWLNDNDMLLDEVRNEVKEIIKQKFVYPKDIIAKIKKDKIAYNNFVKFSDPYKRIRISYIEEARGDKDEFSKRLKNFIDKTREGKLITGFGAVNKYYH